MFMNPLLRIGILTLLLAAALSAQMQVLDSTGAALMTILADTSVGIGTAQPQERLDINGALRVGNTAKAHAGTIRWNGGDFEGYTGSLWKSLTETGGSNWTKIGADLHYLAGHVGVGLSNPSYPFHVGRTSKFEDLITFTGAGMTAAFSSDDLTAVYNHPLMKFEYTWTKPNFNFGSVLEVDFELTGNNTFVDLTNPNAFIMVHGDVNHSGGSYFLGNPFSNFCSSVSFNTSDCSANPWWGYRDKPYFRGGDVLGYSCFVGHPSFDVLPSTITNFAIFEGLLPLTSDDVITNMYGLKMGAVRHGTNNYAIHLADPGVPTAYAIYAAGGRSYFGGNTGIGTTAPQRNLHIRDVMRLEPRSAAPDAPAEGDIYYNGNDHKLYVYDGTIWQACF